MAQVKYGTGTIFQTKDGRWKWQGYFMDDTGKKHRPTKTFNTEAEALKFQAEQVAKTEVKKAMKIDYFDDAELIAEHTKKYQSK